MGLKKFDFTINNNKKKNSIIVSSIIVLVLLVGVTIYATYAKYQETKTYNIIQGKVGEFINADVDLSIKLVDADGSETTATDFPAKNEYVYDASKSSCESGGTISFDTDSWEATIRVPEKDDCTIYFYYYGKGALATNILNHAQANNYYNIAPLTSFKKSADGEYGLYNAEDDYGTSYYYRGDVENNYIKFGKWAEDKKQIRGYYSETSSSFKIYASLDACNSATSYNVNCSEITLANEGDDMYWRIVRINGDGTIRMIYDGIEPLANGTNRTASIGASAYNVSTKSTKYVGYTYENSDGTQTNSTVKTYIDLWYDTNIETIYGSYIADEIFCNDKQIDDTISNETITYYMPRYRMYTISFPKLNCTQDSDKYTVNSEVGNKYLSNPVGLITGDEVVMAGAIYGTNTSAQYGNSTYYLYNGYNYWTLSAHHYNNSGATMLRVTTSGTVYYNNVVDPFEIRPVINLNADVEFIGTGTINNPYEIK